MTAYLQIPGISGDVTAKGHEDWIAITDFKFKIARSINAQPGHITDREGTRPHITQVDIYKAMDKATPLLFSEACVGKAKPEVKLHLCTTGDTLIPYMEYVLANAIVCHYEVQQRHTDQAYPSEIIALNFDKIEMKFTPFDQNHSPQSPIPAGYDLQTAAAI